jgi:hypothetical protein
MLNPFYYNKILYLTFLTCALLALFMDMRYKK